MLTTKPYLRTRRPSPTTVEFIVSTRPPLTLPLRILLGLVYLIRILVALGDLLLFSSACSLYFSTTTDPTTLSTTTTTTNTTNNSSSSNATFPLSSSTSASIPATRFLSLTTLHDLLTTLQQSTGLGRLFVSLARTIPILILAPCCLAKLYILLLAQIHTEERLLVLRGLGIQTSSTGSGGALTATTRFIPTEKIRDVLISEAFRGFEVRHYLVVVVDGEEDVVVVFPRLLPRPKVLEKVWRGVRECLWEYDSNGGGGGGGVSGVRERNGRESGYRYGEKDGVAA